MKFQLDQKMQPAGDQPQAIAGLIKSLKKGYRHQTLLGVTGSGKTFTMANVINHVQKPTLIIAHNKTLAAQLASECAHRAIRTFGHTVAANSFGSRRITYHSIARRAT